MKLQTRCVKIFQNKQMFAAGSIEGRCAIRCVDEAMDNQMEGQGQQQKGKYSFAFRCHREGANIYPVNTIDTFPLASYQVRTGGCCVSLAPAPPPPACCA